jgi:hypothetical protein
VNIEDADDQVFEAALRFGMHRVGKYLDHVFNGDAQGPDRPLGFVLIVFPYGQHDSTDCVSSMSNGANRKDVARLFRAMIANFEREGETQ